jgi:uncharacterized RDD family membrane protein YckC
MTDDKDKDWEFKISTEKEKNNDKEEVKSSPIRGPRTPILPKKEARLTLDESAVPKAKTRSAMAMEVRPEEDLKDEFIYATYPKRAIALIFDLSFLAATGLGIKFLSTIFRTLIQYFMDSYKLKFMIPEPMIMNLIFGISGFLAIFFLIVIPLAFFNVSFGKKLLGLRVRGSEHYTVSIFEAFKREVIFKPLSIVLIAGFITPFFSKTRASIHDMLAHTIVITE